MTARPTCAALALGLAACGQPGATSRDPSSPTPPVASSSPAVAPPAASSTHVYSGHGAASVPLSVLAKYRPEPVPAEVARRIQSLLDLKPPGAGILSPDGKRLFFSWAVTGVSQVFRLDGPDRFPVQLTGGEDVTTVVAVTADGKHLVLVRDRKGEENPGIYVQPADGGPLTVVSHVPGVQTHFQRLSDDGTTLYYTANDRKRDSYVLYAQPLLGGERRALVETEGLWSLADVRDDGALLLRKATGSLTAELFVLTKDGKLTPVLGQGEREEYRAAFGPGESLLISTNKQGNFRRLYAIERGAWRALSPDVPHDVSSFAIDRKRERVTFTINEDGYTRPHVLDARTGQPLALPKLPRADHVDFVSTTPDGRFTTLSIDDGTRPRAAFVLDWKTLALTSWSRPSTPELDTTSFARATLESYPARDGTKIPVFVRRPPRCASSPCPVVVHFHGGPESQARPGFNPSAQMFVDAGFVFVEPNVRGSDGYGKAWLAADDGPKRLEVITDIEDAAVWARQAFAVEGRAPKLGVYGGSYGGYSVLMGMTRFAGAYDAGVDVVGISNLVTFLENTAPYRRSLRVSEYGDPEKDAAALRELSPTTYVDRVKGPLLIVQGATDPRVPVGEAVQMHEALVAKGLGSRLMIFPDEGHGAQRRENQVLMLGHAIAFFREHLR